MKDSWEGKFPNVNECEMRVGFLKNFTLDTCNPFNIKKRNQSENKNKFRFIFWAREEIDCSRLQDSRVRGIEKGQTRFPTIREPETGYGGNVSEGDKCRVLITLGARDFSSAVSGFCQVFIVTRAKMCRPSANNKNSRHTREKPLVPRAGTFS